MVQITTTTCAAANTTRNWEVAKWILIRSTASDFDQTAPLYNVCFLQTKNTQWITEGQRRNALAGRYGYIDI